MATIETRQLPRGTVGALTRRRRVPRAGSQFAGLLTCVAIVCERCAIPRPPHELRRDERDGEWRCRDGAACAREVGR